LLSFPAPPFPEVAGAVGFVPFFFDMIKKSYTDLIAARFSAVCPTFQ
jgi:hypothetical protein